MVIRDCLCGGLLALVLAVGTQAASPALSQSLGQVVSAVVVIDRDALFSGTAFGQRVNEELDSERASLAEETRKIETALEQEERALTEERANLTQEEFRAKADEFDERVQALRTDRDRAQTTYVQKYEAAQRDFYARVGPIIGQLMTDRGAVVVLDKRMVLLSNSAVDVTEEAISRIDAVLGDGSAEDLPETAPEGENTDVILPPLDMGTEATEPVEQ
ncbi:OmpH family outer membrane protein [Maritimibacter sp. DP1N21-5]|uniref:OmpH family outer membrane protein n=1 Tax=Maritimibacter sp. DP1N21-5 TaxID=2836867 RepID=UPI001C4827B1|nr:OmpH family outer membrane protein [Maritimibacter sp. DP1N21-5]MBV7409792.1 OmpH family outer membrane protein [Maritimibacter sp. DP1N21-5]